MKALLGADTEITAVFQGDSPAADIIWQRRSAGEWKGKYKLFSLMTEMHIEIKKFMAVAKTIFSNKVDVTFL